MVKGRKTGTVSAKEKHGVVDWARNLPTDKLGAMVFGCKNHTITECLDKEIFGLPAAHYSYVKNVTPGLPIFLFNYSDRMLHGIFEAVSSGQLNINKHAWVTSEGAASTPYPAQVRVRVHRKCRPLPEEVFKCIIAKNYYEERLFWFELDKEQHRRLAKLFLLSPLPEKPLRPLNAVPSPPNATWQNNTFVFFSRSNVTETDDEEFKNLDSEVCSGMAEMLQEKEQSYALACNRDAFTPKKWTELFKPSVSNNGGVLECEEVILNSSMPDCLDMEWKFASSSVERSEPPLEAHVDSANTECVSDVVECWEDLAFVENCLNATYKNEVACSQYHDIDNDMPDLTDMLSSENKISVDGEVGKPEPSEFDYVPPKEPLEDCERDHEQPNSMDSAFQESNGAASEGVLMGVQPSDSNYVIVKLLQKIEELKVFQLEQMQKIEYLEHELAHSKGEIDQLKRRCHKLESASSNIH